MRTTLTPEQAAVLLASGIPATVVANLMLGVSGRRPPRGLDAPKPRSTREKPSADYRPTVHLYPSATAGNVDASTGHRPGDTMLAAIQRASKSHGVRYAFTSANYYGGAESMQSWAIELANYGYAVVVHDTRDAGLAAIAAEPGPTMDATEPKRPAGPTAMAGFAEAMAAAARARQAEHAKAQGTPIEGRVGTPTRG